MAKKKSHYEGNDAVRHVIKSHSTMLVSMPREIALRAGLRRGVDVRVDQDPKSPGTITIDVLNPADLSAELKAYLAERKKVADKRAKTAAAKEKRDTEAKKKESAEPKNENPPAEPKKEAAVLCKHCKGSGQFAGEECEACGGNGEIDIEAMVSLT